MAKEIEKKFLIRENKIDFFTKEFLSLYNTIDDLKEDIFRNGKEIKQGYFLKVEPSALQLAESLGFNNSFKPVEARLRDKGGEYFLTLKGDGHIERDEFEVKISELLFGEYWNATFGKRVHKLRLVKPYENHNLELDFYLDRDLITAEVEFNSLDEAHAFVLLGKDISEDVAYKNKTLAK